MARNLEQILATEHPDVVVKARAKADEMLLKLHLAELREHGNRSSNPIYCH